MKKILWIVVAALMMTACHEQEKFTIEGTIGQAADEVLYLENVGLKGLTMVDSVKLDEEGQFRFQGERPEGPDFYMLRIGNQIINISIDSTETVRVKATQPNMAANYEVEGSENCQKIRELALLQQELHRKAMTLDDSRLFSRTEAQDSLQRLINNYKEMVKEEYIFKAPNMTYAYFALFQTLGRWLIFDPEANADDLKVFAAVATSWDTFHPETERTRNLHDIVIRSMQDQRIVNARNANQGEPVMVETGVIDIQLADSKGQQRTLTELKGKVVLLDFHSFALKDSPQRILMLRGLYNKYHEQGLEIYQVSLDPDEHFWRQMTEHLPWICTRDASGQSAASYNVQQVPEFFLIDRNNQLQKRSSQINDLEEEIKQMLSFRQ
jgi:peroxiredoxin